MSNAVPQQRPLATRLARRFPRFGLLCALSLAFLFAPAHAAGLNDTGFATCADGASNNQACAPSEPTNYPRQDGRYGRDAAAAKGVLYKVGGGSAGFDFTKIANNGTDLTAGASLGSAATDWACTRDNVTGLVWEVKTTSGLRSTSNTYTWYSTDTTSNGGNAGTANGGTCSGGSGCDTKKFVADGNAAALCGYTDWRMPTAKELQSLVDFSLSGTGPATIDATYFPNTQAGWYWSADNFAADPTNAWSVYFGDGSTGHGLKPVSYYVWLVRGGQ